MTRLVLTTFTMLAVLSAWGLKDKSKTNQGFAEARGPDGHLEDGFYLQNTHCESFGNTGIYVEGDRFSVTTLNIRGESCSNPSISIDDVRVYSLTNALSWETFSATLADQGLTAHTDGLRTLIFTDAIGFDETFTKHFTNRDTNKEVSMTVNDIIVTKPASNYRKITAKVVVHGPNMDWEPWVWCASPSEPDKMLRIENERGSYVGPSPSFTLEANVDSYRYQFPTSCRINVGFLAPSADESFNYFLDVIRGEIWNVE